MSSQNLRDTLQKLDHTLGGPPYNVSLQDRPFLRPRAGYGIRLRTISTGIWRSCPRLCELADLSGRLASSTTRSHRRLPLDVSTRRRLLTNTPKPTVQPLYCVRANPPRERLRPLVACRASPHSSPRGLRWGRVPMLRTTPGLPPF